MIRLFVLALGVLAFLGVAQAQIWIMSPASQGGRGVTTLHIALSNTSIVAGSANGTTLGTASIVGTVTGTASWSLTDVSGTFQINSSTGVVTVLSNTALTIGNTIPITISVSGVTPTVSSAPFTINVTGSACTNQLVINYGNTCALIAQAYGE